MDSPIILVGLDRDNTLHYDDTNGFFGKDDDWRDNLALCDGVVDGLKVLKGDERIRLVVATNQSGVARGVLTEERVRKVNAHLDSMLRENGVQIDGWYYAPQVSHRYAERWRRRGVPYNEDYVTENHTRKPRNSMLEQAAKDLGYPLDELQVYFIGDRSTDVETGLNANGSGILIYNGRNRRDYARTFRIHENAGRAYIVNNFLEAARTVLREINP